MNGTLCLPCTFYQAAHNTQKLEPSRKRPCGPAAPQYPADEELVRSFFCWLWSCTAGWFMDKTSSHIHISKSLITKRNQNHSGDRKSAESASVQRISHFYHILISQFTFQTQAVSCGPKGTLGMVLRFFIMWTSEWKDQMWSWKENKDQGEG